LKANNKVRALMSLLCHAQIARIADSSICWLIHPLPAFWGGHHTLSKQLRSPMVLLAQEDAALSKH